MRGRERFPGQEALVANAAGQRLNLPRSPVPQGYWSRREEVPTLITSLRTKRKLPGLGHSALQVSGTCSTICPPVHPSIVILSLSPCCDCETPDWAKD